MKNILITNADAHTFPSTYYSLRKEFDCDILSSSRQEFCPNGFLTDSHVSFFNVTDDVYAPSILNFCVEHDVDVIVPLSIHERLILLSLKDKFSEKGISIISVDAEKIHLANDKLAFARVCEANGIPVPRYEVVSTYLELKSAAKRMGYPKNKVIIKPVVGSGSRGFRILNAKVNYKTTFYSSRPDQLVEVKLSSLKGTLGDTFSQPLIVNEFLCGNEFTVDCLCYADQEVIIPRERLETKNGLTDVGQVVKHDEIIAYTRKLVSILEIKGIFGFQFKLDSNGVPKMLECNPRIQGTMIMSTLAGANIIAEAVRRARGLEPRSFEVDWGMMFYRINSGFSIGKDIQIMNIVKKGQIEDNVGDLDK